MTRFEDLPLVDRARMIRDQEPDPPAPTPDQVRRLAAIWVATHN